MKLLFSLLILPFVAFANGPLVTINTGAVICDSPASMQAAINSALDNNRAQLVILVQNEYCAITTAPIPVYAGQMAVHRDIHYLKVILPDGSGVHAYALLLNISKG